MKRRFTFLAATFTLLTFLALPMGMRGQTRTEVTYDFSEIPEFDQWGSSYSQHIVEYDDATVTFASANKNTQTITDIPVTKGQPVSLVLNDLTNNITSATFVCRQWGTKAQTITLHYSTDGGTSYSSTGVTSTNFTISSSSLPEGTNAVRITFSSSSNQVGIESATINFSASTSTTVATPTFNPASGTEFGDEGLQVSITCATEGVDIYYTLDGSEPDDESISYSAPISLTETTTIKAIAYDGDDNNSAVATATYTYVDPNAPGTENNPYTVAQARAAIDANAGTQGVYATGIVSAIPTAYSSQHSNITFNMVDEEGDEDFLQAYRCSGEEAANVAVGDVVLVYGNLTLYTNSNTGVTTYEFASGCQLVSLTHPTGYVEAPTFSPAAGTYDEAQNVTINCANANATIYYTLDGTEPTNASTPYTTAINIATTTTIKAIAYVGANASTVTTAEYAIVPVANISSITEVGTSYVVKGTVVATNSRGFVMGDGTGYVYYYKNGTVSQSIGDMVKVSGTTGTYGQIIQFTNTATVTGATTSNYDGTPAATVITEVPDYSTGYHLSTYFEFEGELTKSNSNYFITLGEEQIQISYPTTAQGNALTALNGKTVHVKGYFTGINSSSKFTVMLESAEEVVSTEPVINADDITLTYDATSGEIEYTITNPVEGTTLNATCDAEWVSNIVVGESSITFNVTENEGEEDRTATITLTYTGAENKTVTVTQGHFVVDYATLPFSWDDTSTPTGITNHGVGTYSSSPYLKFDGAGDYIILKFNEEPGTLTFDIKGNPSNGVWSGTFKVQTSEDGETYTDLETYTNLTSTVQSERFDNLDENVRYIKWIYTEKSSGNVALGNIHLYELGGGPALETYDLTVEPFENLEIYTFVENENEAALEGAGTIQVTEGDQVMLSITANEGYVIQSLMVDGVNVISQIDETDAYTFFMPAHNVTVTATAVEIVVPTGSDFVRISSLDQLTDGSVVVIAARYDEGHTNGYYAMSNASSGKPTGVLFTSVTSGNNETLPTTITDDEDDYYWTVNVTEDGYTFTNADGDMIGYGTSGTNFVTGGTNTEWTIESGTAGNSAMVAGYTGFVIKNNNTNSRAFAFNGSAFGPYAWTNNNAAGYNFYLDFFVQTEATQTVTQTVALAAGSNWFSTNLEITLDDLQAALRTALPNAANRSIKITSQNSGYSQNLGNNWNGQLKALDVAQMYMITVPSACEITLEGEPIDPAEHPVNIVVGSNWIGFPLQEVMTLNNAFAGFGTAGDIVKSQTNGQATKRGNAWMGQLKNLVPGKGYIYNASAIGTLTFPTSAK